jgi:GntR family transcriptional regulator/MocR family aminotransferase
MVLPNKLHLLCKKQKRYTDVHTDSLNQYTLAQFIQNGEFEKHIWKMKKHYRKNRAILIKEMMQQCSYPFDILGHAAGLHLLARFHNTVFTKEHINLIAKNGVRIYPLRDFCCTEDPAHDNTIVFGYAHLTPEKIAQGIQVMSNFIT